MSYKEEILKWHNGVEYFEANDYETALDLFESITDTSQTSKISFNMGMAFLQIGQVENAIQSFNAAVRKDAYLAVAHFQLGACRYRIRRYKDALNDYDMALEKMRGVRLIDYTQLGLPYKLYSSYVLFNRGLCFMKLGNIDVGMEDLEDARRDKPKDAQEDIEKIEQAVKLNARAADKLPPFEVPRRLVYKPAALKVENTAKVDYLGSSKLVAAIEASDNYTGFSGKKLKAATLDRLATARGPLDEGDQSPKSPGLQRAATYSSRLKTVETVRTMEKNNSFSSDNSSDALLSRSKTVDVASTSGRSGASSFSSREPSSYEASSPSWQASRGGQTSPEQDPSMFRPRKQSLAAIDSPIQPYGQRRPSADTTGRRPSDDAGFDRSNSISSRLDSPSESFGPGKIKLKSHYKEDTFMMLLTSATTFHELSSRIQRKFGTSHPLRLRYVDEDGEKVLMTDQEDMDLAFRLYDIPIGSSGNSTSRDLKLEIWCSND